MTSHNNFELFEEIGRSDATVVYRAHDLTLGRDVAIKELTAEGKADPRRQERLLREAQFLAQNEHPGVLRIHTVVPENGWIVMELMSGSLASQIQHAALPPDTVRSVLRQLLSALEFLHGLGKLHGAIRPSNILIDAKGTVRLSDFEPMDLDGELRPPTSTQKYLAPEWIRSEFGQLGPASDLYCLAFTALELLVGPKFDSKMLTGQGAAVDANVAWLRVHSGEEPLARTSDLLRNVPSDLANTLDVMLQKNVADRPATAADALKRLDEQPIVQVQAIQPASPAPVEAAGIMPASVKQIDPLGVATKRSTDKDRKPAGASVVAVPATGRDRLNQTLEKPYVLYPLCALLLFGALGIGLYLRADKSPDPTLAELSPVPKVEEVVKDKNPPQIVDEPAKPTEPAAEIIAAEENTETPVDPIPEQLVEQVNEPAEEEPTADPIDKIAAADSSEETMELAPPVIDEQPADEVAAIEQVAPEEVHTEEVVPQENPLEGILSLISTPVEVDTAKLLAEFKGNPELVIDAGGFLSESTDVAIDPQGRWVAATGGKVVRLWDLQTGRLAMTLRGDRSRTSYGDCNTLAFSPDGEYLVVGVSDYQPHGAIRVYRTDALDQIESLLPGHTSPVRQINFSRDGNWMTSADADGNIAVWDWDARKIVNQIPPRDPQAPIVDELMFAGSEDVLLGIDTAGPFLLQADTLRKLTAADNLPSRLYAWMFDLLTSKLRYPFETKVDPRVLDLRLDDNVWAAAAVGKQDGGNKFWIGVWPAHEKDTASVPDPQTVYTGHRWKVRAISLAPSIGVAASCDMFGEVHVWDMRDGKPLHRLRCEGKPIYEAVFDRDSARIGFGTKPYRPDIWARNNYGAIDQVLDLATRSIYQAGDDQKLSPIQERPNTDREQLQVRRIDDEPGISLVKMRDGRQASRYQLTTGRSPTVFSIIQQPTLGLQSPVLLGDSEGMLAVWNSDSDQLKRAFIGHEAMVTSISVAPHGRTMLSGSSDRSIRLWSLENPEPTGIFDFKFENVSVTKVVPGTSSARAGVQVGDRVVSIDGKSIKEMFELMLTGEFDYRPGQSVPVQMTREGNPYEFEMQLVEGYDFSEPILSVYIGDQDRWIAWTPQGYYDASPGAENLIGWHINRGPNKSAAYFEVGQFRDQLYRPDIIDRLLKGQAIEDAVFHANAEREEAALDFRSPSDLAVHHPPYVRLLSPQVDQTLQDGSVTVEVDITSANGLPIREVTLLVNGITVKTFQPESPAETEMSLAYPVELEPGENSIEVVATNAESRGLASATVDVAEQATEIAAVDKSNLVVLAIGVNEKVGETDLASASQPPVDAQQFAESMREQGNNRLYENVYSKVLLQGQATRSEILDAFQWMVDQTEPGDTVAIYLAAEAFIDSTKNFYIGAHDVDMDRPRATAVSWREFVNTLQTDLPACKRLVFLDLDPSEQAIEPGLRNPLVDLAAPELGTVFFSSTALQQRLPSHEPGEAGFLTTALKRTIGDPRSDVTPSPPDGLLSCEETSKTWMAKVKELSGGKLYPIAFTPTGIREVNVFQATP
tara:strand:+ start:246986 stop:251620 length:4635 start_codon:yes stop_codon:yes gene_type:complete